MSQQKTATVDEVIATVQRHFPASQTVVSMDASAVPVDATYYEMFGKRVSLRCAEGDVRVAVSVYDGVTNAPLYGTVIEVDARGKWFMQVGSAMNDLFAELLSGGDGRAAVSFCTNHRGDLRPCGNPGVEQCKRCGQPVCGVHGYDMRGTNCNDHPIFWKRLRAGERL